MNGRKPKPNSIKIAKGTRRDKLNKHEAPPVPGDPVCPVELDAIGRQAWDRLVADLKALKILSRTDASTIEIYCISYSRWRQAEERLSAEGLIIKAKNGSAATSPYWRIAAEAKRLCLRVLVELGLSPTARTRVKSDVAALSAGDELDGFLEAKA